MITKDERGWERDKLEAQDQQRFKLLYINQIRNKELYPISYNKAITIVENMKKNKHTHV